MKIAHLVPAMEQGGVESVVCLLSRELIRAGHASVVISRGGCLDEQIRRDGGATVLLDLKSKNPFTYVQRALRLRRVLRAQAPDLVCVHSRVPAWLFVFANRALGLKWITYAHGANSVSRYSAIMTKGTVTIAPSRFLAEHLKAHYPIDPKRLFIVPNAVDTKRFDPSNLNVEAMDAFRRAWNIKPGEKVVMAIGRITPIKGLDGLVRAFNAGHFPGARLVIVGSADRHHEAYARALREMAGDRVVFAGAQTQIPECLALASVLVSANVSKPESFGLSMAEALSMGVPVVARAFGGALDIVRDGPDGELVQENDFVAAIQRVLATPGDAAERRLAAVERFGIAAMMRKTLAIYGGI